MNPDPGQGRQKWSLKKGKKSGDTIFIRTIWKGGWFSLRTSVLYKVKEENLQLFNNFIKILSLNIMALDPDQDPDWFK